MVNLDLKMSMNAILVTDCIVPWTAIELVYVVPPINSGRSWVLYKPDLRDKFKGSWDTQLLPMDMPMSFDPIRPFPKTRVRWIADGERVIVANRSTQRGSPLVFTAGSCSPLTQSQRRAKWLNGSLEKAKLSVPRLASSNPKAVANMPVEAALKKAVRIAKTQVRVEKELE